MKLSVFGKNSEWRMISTSWYAWSFPILKMLLVLVLCIFWGASIAFMLSNALSASDTARITNTINSFPVYAFGGLIVSIILMIFILIFRQNELAVVILVMVQLYVDWYLGLAIVALIMGLLLLLIFFLYRSSRFLWTKPHAFWLWVAFLVVSLFPASQGSNRLDSITYYLAIMVGSLVFFWLGSVISRNIDSTRRFLKIFASYGTLVAIHTIIQALTGIFLFASSRYDAYLSQVGDFHLTGTARVGSFFVNPDTAGVFLAMMVFFPLGAFVESRSIWEKLLYLIEMLLIVIALLFTYSTGGWAATGIGLITFTIFVGRNRYRVLIPVCIVIAVVLLLFVFPNQVNIQLQHASDPSELSLRKGAWLTGIRVIEAFPVTGLGLGRYVYIARAEPYRVPEQIIPLFHPHNSYLEMSALAGLPVSIIFVALLLFALWKSWCNWRLVEVRMRALLGSGIASVIALSANSLSSPGWTNFALSIMGWLILGAISSPLLTQTYSTNFVRKNTNNLSDI